MIRLDYLPPRPIPLGAIRWRDDTFRLRCARPDGPESLAASIARIGVLTPPVVQDLGSSEGLRIVSGFARIHCLHDSGDEEIEARVLPADASPAALLWIGIEENLASRGLNPAEQAMAAKRLAEWVGEDETIANFLPLLGRRPSRAVFEKMTACLELVDPALESLARGGIDEATAALLAELNHPGQQALIERTEALSLSVGERRDTARRVVEIVRRDDTDGVTLLKSLPRAEESMDGQALRETRSRFMDELRRLRQPILSSLEEDFAQSHRRIGLGSNARIAPPRDFEGGRFELRAALKSPEDLRNLSERLQAALENESDAVEALFTPQWEPRDSNGSKP